MKTGKIYLKILMTLAAALFLTGCSSLPLTDRSADKKQEPSPVVTQAAVSVKDDAEVTSKIVVSEYGYDTDEKKILYVISGEAETTFWLVDATGTKVFEGELEKLETAYSEFDVYEGNFTKFEETGIYKVMTDGKSDGIEITIDNNNSKKLFEQKYNELIAMSGDSEEDECFRLAMLIFIREFYADAYCDRNFINDSVRNIAELQLDSDFSKNATSGELDEIMIQAAVSAKYASVMADEDSSLASEALAWAKNSFKLCDSRRDDISGDILYFAAAELYKASNDSKYKTVINEYDNNKTADKESVYSYWGDIAYLTTVKGTDYSRCERILNGYLALSNRVADEGVRNSLWVREDISSADLTEVFKNMMVIGISDYVLSCEGYSRVQKNYLNYLYGRNPEQKNMMEDFDNNIRNKALVVFAFAE